MKIATMENESHGVLKTLFSKMGWAYREQPVQDVGIDAHVEIADGEGHTVGKLLAIQAKAGASFFDEEEGDAWVFRTNADHRDYWVSHSLPVLIVLVDLEEGVAYYARLDESAFVSTGKMYKVLVPKQNLLGPDAATELASFAEGPEEVQRYRTLALGLDLMKAIANEAEVFLESEEWINKSSGRGSITLVVQDAQGSRTERDWGLMAPGWSYDELFAELVPWASFEVDDEVYADAEEQEYMDTWGVYDKEDDVVLYDQEDFRENRADSTTIRPYEVVEGEVARYRLRLGLNDLGKGFLIVDDFIRGGAHWEERKRIWKP